MRKVLPWVGLGLLALTLGGSTFGCSSSSSGGLGGSAGSGGSTGGTFGTGGSAGSGTGGSAGSGTGGTFGTGGSAGSGTGGSAGSGTGGSAGSGTGGSGGSGTSGTGGTGGSGSLGKACTANTDCGSGMTCLTPNSNISGGGPGGGYCTKTCAQNSDCQGLDPNAQCVNLGTQASPAAYCLEGCTQGGTSVDPNKCHGRVTDGQGPVACTQLFMTNADGGIIDSGAPIFACEPFCGSDADCGSKKCDLSTGLCDTTPKTGLPIGSSCNPQAIRGGAADPCAGVCVGNNPSDSTQGECSAICVVGTIGCGSQQGQTMNAACLFVFGQTEGPGDEGACGQLCDCNSQCHNSNDICNSLAGTGYDTATGRAGYCAPPQGDAGTGITTCP